MLLAVSLLAVFLAVVLAAVLASRRRRLPEVDPARAIAIGESVRGLAGLTGGALYEQNEVSIFQNGDLLEALKDAIRDAHSTIHLESYLWSQGTTEDEFVALLCRKAKEGVAVRVLLDTVGAIGASRRRVRQLRLSGVHVGFFHGLSWLHLRRLNNRTHRKLLIVDGEVGFTFGHGIQDEWRGDARNRDEWRDTGVRLRGPVVCPLQVIFTQNWIETVGAPLQDSSCFARGETRGDVACHLVSSSSRGGYSSVALLYMLAIASARREVIIQNPYFAPGPTVTRLLKEVVARGVTVHLMVPGEHSDSPLLRRAGQRLYRPLLEAGVRIYLYDKTFMHQKIMIIDGTWSHIGSTNFDARSLRLNAEVGVGLMDETVACQLTEAFRDDLTHSRELTLEQWRSRPTHQQLLDWCTYQLYGQL